jgi:protein-L-isoaspartate(D-aspartate) O-methyltransferase
LNAQNAKIARLIHYLRQNGITDEKVLSAIQRIPREKFIPSQMIDKAWEDMAIPIGRGQTISQPYVVAAMTQALELTDRHKVLEIGTGSGYQACILSKICRRVYSIERHKPLLEGAEKIFADLHIRNITAICADGMKGWPRIHGIDQAPFDRIIVTAAARDKPPSALIDQLVVGGIMIVPVGGPGEQVLRRYYKESEDAYSYRDLMPVRFVPLLPDIASDKEGAGEEAA